MTSQTLQQLRVGSQYERRHKSVAESAVGDAGDSDELVAEMSINLQKSLLHHQQRRLLCYDKQLNQHSYRLYVSDNLYYTNN